MTTFIGGDRSDFITGGAQNDTIKGLGGNDSLFGKEGSDTIFGGTGDDYLAGGDGVDTLYGEAGVNELWGGYQADKFVIASREVGYTDDTITDFSSISDLIDLKGWGISSFDQVRDIMKTDGGGNALLSAAYDGFGHYLTIQDYAPSDLDSQDFIFAIQQSQNDTGTRFDDVMFGSHFADQLHGDDGNDDLLGGLGKDKLFGDAGNDHLIGSSGNDVLTGGRGRDMLEGNSGGDIFRFASAADSFGTNHDVILDFLRNTDTVDLSKIDANAILDGDQAFEFAGSSIFTGVGQIIFAKVDGYTIIAGNTDADNLAEFEIWISGIFTPAANDFIL